MKPRPSSNTDLHGDPFKVEFAAIIDPDHALVRLAGQSDRAFFEHTLPIDSSSMTRWRKLIGEKGAEGLLAESIATSLKTQTIKPASLDKLSVDTTVQEKAITFPTDARLYCGFETCASKKVTPNS